MRVTALAVALGLGPSGLLPVPPPAPILAASVGVVHIHEIQGGLRTSPYDGRQVARVPGIVTAVTGTGFWFQDPAPDHDDATSEGLYVTGRTKVVTGDAVQVAGTVTETLGKTGPQITATAVTVTAHGRPLPAPVVIGKAGRRPPTGAIAGPGARLDPATHGLDFYRSLLGMRVTVDDAVATGPRTAAGEVAVLPDNGAGAAVRTTRGGIALQATDANPERVIFAGAVPAVSTGDGFPGHSTGILDYSSGRFRFLVGSLPPVVGDSPAREAARLARTDELAVATFDLDALDPSDPPAKFQGLALQIVDRLRSPDLIAVQEVEDNSGPENDGTVAADQTVAQLVGAISAAGGPAYGWRSIDPADGADGGPPGANIRSGFLYRTDRGLAFTDRGNAPAAGTVTVDGGLAQSPGLVAAADPAWANVRKPLAGEFTWRGRRLFVIANHWNSTTGDDPLYGLYQPPRQQSEAQRVLEARDVAAFVQSLQAADPKALVVVAGDLNAPEWSPSVKALTGPTGLIDLPARVPVADRYTAIQDGNSEVLDHILLSPALAALPYDYQIVHVNAEYADQVSSHDPSVVRLTLG
jgi:endonuclease/exonuclease/phosphatase family metal-dependent hydrolase